MLGTFLVIGMLNKASADTWVFKDTQQPADAQQSADAERSAGATTAAIDDQRHEPVSRTGARALARMTRKTPQI
jgi:hypothetical protein